MHRAFVLLGLCLCAAAAADPFAGTWRLDAAASQVPAGVRPVATEIVIEPVEAGLHDRSTTRAEGLETSAEFTAGFDGRPALVRGTRGLLWPVRLRRVDPATIAASYGRGLTVLARSHWTVDAAAGVLVVRTATLDADGDEESALTAVYRRAAAD